MQKKEKLGHERLNVLVIEDNEHMLDIMMKALRRIGFERLIRAKNGKEAIEHLKMEPVRNFVYMSARAFPIYSDA